MKKKIIFVEPSGVKPNVFSIAMELPLLGPIYLATILKNEGYDVTVYNENILGRNISDKELNADILCLTSLTSTVYRAYDIAMRFRQLNPNSRVIMGGIHATFLKEEAIQYVDHVVVGEGESEIVNLIKNGSKEKFIYAKPYDELNKIPNPDFTVLKNYKKIGTIPIMTSRGCPFGCNFCSVTKMFGRKYRTVSNDKVIEQLKNKHGFRTRSVFFYDDNFVANKQRTYSLLDDMKKNNLNISWSAQVRCDVVNDDYLLKRMSESGCERVYVGVESVNQKTLDNYNKSQTVLDIKTAIRKFHNNNIKVHGMFVLGSDADDRTIFRKTSAFVNQNDFDFVQYMALTPLPGTDTFFNLEKENRLLHKKWNYYDGMHVVYKPKLLTPLELQQGIIDCYSDFYSYFRAMNVALNITYDSAANYLYSSSSKINDFLVNKFGITAVVKSIISTWMRYNKDYMKYLGRV